MKAAAELVVHAAPGHLAQREQGHVAGVFVAAAMVVAKEEVQHHGPWKFGRAAEAPVGRIEAVTQGGIAGGERVGIERGSRGADAGVVVQLVENMAGGGDQRVAL